MSNATDRSEELGLGLHGFFSEYFKAGDEGYQQKNLTGRAPLKRRDKSRFFFDMNPHFYIIISFHIQFASSKAHLTNRGVGRRQPMGVPLLGLSLRWPRVGASSQRTAGRLLMLMPLAWRVYEQAQDTERKSAVAAGKKTLP